MIAFNKRYSLEEMELANLLNVIDFAAKKHRDQRRLDKEKTPYINHPIGN